MKKIFLSLIGLIILSLGIYSCNKEDNNLITSNINNLKLDTTGFWKVKLPKKQKLHYRGTIFETMPKLDDNGYLIGYDNLPEIFKEFRKDTNIISVTYVIIYDNYDDIYLFDDTLEFQEAVKFENSKNVLKGNGTGACWTFEHLNPNSIMHAFSSIDPKGYDFGKVYCWGYSLPWVYPQYNDKMSMIALFRNWGNNEHTHFMGCADANWGGQQIRISLPVTSNSGNLANLHSYPYAFGWGWFIGSTTWGDRISSCEMFQTNALLYGYKI